MKNIILVLLAYLFGVFIVPTNCQTYDFTILSQNNTGPTDRSRPVLLCYPAVGSEVFPKCFVAGGVTLSEDSFPVAFYCDVWRADIDLNTQTVQWTQLESTAPSAACGGFHQFWRNNLTSFSYVAGLNGFGSSGFQCNGTTIVTYDFVSQSFELTVPNGGNWGTMAAGGCDRYLDDVYCFGGFDCSTFQDTNSWTKYNIPTNTFSVLNTANLSSLPARHHASLNCIEKSGVCVIGSGDKFTGGTVDQWTYYDVEDDQFIFFEPKDKQTNTQYLSADIAQVWKIVNGDFVVFRESNKMLVVGGDNATGSGSDTIRYVGVYNLNSRKFKEKDADGLFTIKQEYLSNIPQIKGETTDCDYFIEYGGSESNEEVAYHYVNQVVLHQVC